MPYRLTGTFGHMLDGGVMMVSMLVLIADGIGARIDASATIAAYAGLLIAIGRTALYLAQAYKTVRDANRGPELEIEFEPEES